MARAAIPPPALRMTVPRAVHTATALPDGSVLLAGGFLRNGALLDSAELFDPRARSFTAIGPMPAPRTGHSATLLRSGKVLVAGGRGGEERLQSAITATALLYDPATRRFTATGSMTTPRSDQTATLLADGRVLLAGGDARGEEATASAELYDPATGAFTATGPMTSARSYHAAALLPDGRVLVAGGGPSLAKVLASTELFDPRTGHFSPAAPMATARRKLAAVNLADGRVLLAGGADLDDYAGKLSSVELYDPAVSRFLPGPPMHAGRFKVVGSATAFAGGALVAGGAPGSERFDAKAFAFRALDTGPAESHYYATATLLASGAVLVAGGYTGHGAADAGAFVVEP